MTYSTKPGRPLPLGATVRPDGINFAMVSQHATAVFLELYDAPGDERPTATFRLDASRNRSGHIWHIFVQGVGDGQLYGYRVDGPYTPEDGGHRFNVNKLLADPFGRAYAGSYQTEHAAVYGYDRDGDGGDLSFSEADSAPHTVRTVAVAPEPFDWGEDRPLRIPLEETVLYEAHVKGLTGHPLSGAAAPGTYLGVLDKLPHLKRLGITTLELLPVHEFNRHERVGFAPDTGQPLYNYWGYSSLGFFAPHRAYATEDDGQRAIDEFREMVKRLHAEGIEVILDVVYNHTAEGSERGPTLSFRGLDNALYYMLAGSGRHYRNYSGCGNTVNCNHPVVKQLILESLRYWVVEMHVDGFRFDLAPILGRGPNGAWLGHYNLLRDIAHDPLLGACKLISESWDAAGLYVVGQLSAEWAEWNGRFRDDVRRFVRGDADLVSELGRRLGGSVDIFGAKGLTGAAKSINFVTAHDGFTLRDVVSYREKHNLANGEENRDGTNDNYSHNWGVEGDTKHPGLLELRRRQAKNLLTITTISRGTPMFVAGDELWRTQRGNNNAYNQDNELSWIDWRDDANGAEMLRFTSELIAFRRRHPALRRPVAVDPFSVGDHHDISFHGVEVNAPDWSQHSRSLAMWIRGAPPPLAPETPDDEIYVLFNAWSDPLEFTLPELEPPLRWFRAIDTSIRSPAEILADDAVTLVDTTTYPVPGRSVVVLLGRTGPKKPPKKK